MVYVDKCTQGCEIILCLLFKCNFKKLVYMNSSQGFKMHQTIKTARSCMFSAIWCYSNYYMLKTKMSCKTIRNFQAAIKKDRVILFK